MVRSTKSGRVGNDGSHDQAGGMMILSIDAKRRMLSCAFSWYKDMAARPKKGTVKRRGVVEKQPPGLEDDVGTRVEYI